jgi:hypothetical protein
VNQGARRNMRRAPAAGPLKQADPHGRPPAAGPGLGLCSSVAVRPLSRGGARRGSGTVRMREGEEVQEATRVRTANSRVSEEGPTMRRTDSTRSCALAALSWSLARPSRHTAAALSPSRLRADRGLLERRCHSLRRARRNPGSPSTKRARRGAAASSLGCGAMPPRIA